MSSNTFSVKFFKKTILPHKLLFAFCLFCFALIPFYYYCKFKTLKWLHDTNFLVHAGSVYTTVQDFKLVLKIDHVEVINKNPKASVKKITAESIVVIPSLFSFMKLFSSYAFGFKLKGLKINEHGQLYGELVNGKGEIIYSSGVYHLNNLIIEPFKFELTPEYSTLEKGKLRKAATHYKVHLVKLNGYYISNNKEFFLDLNIPKPTELKENNRNYSIQAQGGGAFSREKLKEEYRLPLKGNIKFNIDGFSCFLSHLHEAQLISGIADNVGAALGYPITKQKLNSKELQEIMTNSVSLNLKLDYNTAYIGVLKIYP
jgi:hypothetical protein